MFSVNAVFLAAQVCNGDRWLSNHSAMKTSKTAANDRSAKLTPSLDERQVRSAQVN